ncbi:uncharacterized protein V6R79_002392 [Siganus canaliculatus]
MSGDGHQEHESGGDASHSDEDSVSLLSGLNACQSRGGAAEDMEMCGADSPPGNKEQNVDAETQINQLSLRELGISSDAQSAAGCAASISRLAADVLRSEKIPSKKNLLKRNSMGETRLHRACRRKDVAQVRALIQAGISVNAKDNAGWTALHEACSTGDEAVVEELLKSGADVNAKSCEGITPLHDAVESGGYQVVKLLLQHGSNSSDKHAGGLSALDLAEEENIKQLLATFQAAAVKQDQNSETPDRQEHAARHRAALTHIQSVLTEALDKHCLEKDHIAQKYRTVPVHFRHLVLKSHLDSLASRQRTLVELLQHQIHLEEKFVSMMDKVRLQPPKCPTRTEARTKPSRPPSTTFSSKASEQSSCSQSRTQRPSQGKESQIRGDVLPVEARSFQVKRNQALIQRRPENNNRKLSELIQSGVMTPGGHLELVLKGQRHVALLQADGSIRDSKGRLHVAPERWFESIVGNNIPVGSSYAWNKVTFRDKPLSSYLLNTEANGSTPQTCPNVDAQQRMAGSSQEELTADILQMILNIRTIRLVQDEEMVPNAVVDDYWEKLLKEDVSEAEDWL